MSLSDHASATERTVQERLDALVTGPDGTKAVFDALARGAAEVCGAPIGVIAIDDPSMARLASVVGLDSGDEVPRDVAFCNARIPDGEPVEVPDALADAQLGASLLVRNGIGIRFFAGVAIGPHQGPRVGTLSVVDRRVRTLDAHQRAALASLADAAGRVVESRALARAQLVRVIRAQVVESHLAAIVRGSDDAIIGKTLDGIITSWNGGATSLFGYSAAEALGHPITMLFPPDRLDEEDEFIRRIKNGETVRHYETVRRRKDGSRVDISVSLSPIRNEAGDLVGVAKVARDITRRRAMEERLAGALSRESQLAAIVRGSEDAIIGKTLDGTINSWNNSATRLFGYAPEEMLGKSIATLVPADRLGEERELIERIRKGETVRHYETVRRRKDGSLVDVSVSLSPVRDSAGVVVGAAKVARDLTERRALERRIREEHERLRVTLASILDAVITTDLDGNVQWLNPAAERLTGWVQDAAEKRHVNQVFHVISEDVRSRIADPLALCLAENRPAGLAHHSVLVSRDGTERAIDDSASPIRDANGRVVGGVLVFHDVSEQRRMTKEMSFRATHDGLTGLVNRTEFDARLQQSLDAAAGNDAAHALMFIDLDQFKLVNDSCGHSAGDELLRQVSALFAKTVRSGDLLARLGGDEFGVLLEHCTVEQASGVAQQICDRMDVFRFVHQERTFRLGASVGVVPVDHRWRDSAAVLQAGDSACYAAKEAGRNRVHVDNDRSEQSRVRGGETEWASRLAQALDEGRFLLYGQRIVPIHDAGEGLRLEVLLRVRAEDGAVVAPPALFSAAERFHIASRIDRWVIDTAFTWMAEESRLATHVSTVCVNLSGQSVGDRQFHRFVEDRLRAAAFDPRKLCFEITETAAITTIADATVFVEQMRALGVRIALDDFGAGASAFGYLKSLPVDYLKIDGQFIRNMVEDPLDRAAVRCFHDLARVVGLKTVAEFVERDATLDTLRDIGIDYAQGYLLHRPEPLMDLLDRYAAPRADASAAN